MAEKELTLDQRLAVLLVALEESQGVSLALQEGLAQERDSLRRDVATQLKALEDERKKLSTELPRALREETGHAVDKILSVVSQSTAKKLEEHHAPLLATLKDATERAKAAGEQARQSVEGVSEGWKVATLRFLYAWGAAVGGVFLFGLMLWSFSSSEREREMETHTALAQSTALLRVEHEKMSEEIKEWKAAGVGKIELELCPESNAGSLCVRVDKKKGAFGKEKDFFVPLGSPPGRN